MMFQEGMRCSTIRGDVAPKKRSELVETFNTDPHGPEVRLNNHHFPVFTFTVVTILIVPVHVYIFHAPPIHAPLILAFVPFFSKNC